MTTWINFLTIPLQRVGGTQRRASRWTRRTRRSTSTWSTTTTSPRRTSPRRPSRSSGSKRTKSELLTNNDRQSEGRFTVVGQILPSVKLILGVMFISEWPQNDRPFCWSFLSHFLLVKMNLSSKMTSHFFREKCLWPPKWPTLKQVSQSLEISGRNEFDRQNESDRRLWNVPQYSKVSQYPRNTVPFCTLWCGAWATACSATTMSRTCRSTRPTADNRSKRRPTIKTATTTAVNCRVSFMVPKWIPQQQIGPLFLSCPNIFSSLVSRYNSNL